MTCDRQVWILRLPVQEQFGQLVELLPTREASKSDFHLGLNSPGSPLVWSIQGPSKLGHTFQGAHLTSMLRFPKTFWRSGIFRGLERFFFRLYLPSFNFFIFDIFVVCLVACDIQEGLESFPKAVQVQVLLIWNVPHHLFLDTTFSYRCHSSTIWAEMKDF